VSPLVTETGIDLSPDRTRVITRLFVAGREDVGPGDSRASAVIERILALSEDAVEAAMSDLDKRFDNRHRDLHDTFLRHAELVRPSLESEAELSEARQLLLGAAFTHEYAIEGAALCNPSGVLHPDQGVEGGTRFIISVRGIGEGHRSSIGFRTGTITPTGLVTIDDAGPYPVTAEAGLAANHRSVFHTKLAEVDDDRENAAYVLDALALVFDDVELEGRVEALAAEVATRRHTSDTIDHLRSVARSSYSVEFHESTELSERVLWPHAPAEEHGMEDARFVRFTCDDGSIVYHATYTAFDGVHVAQHLLTTTDFASFTASPMAGDAAVGKGLALFPRKVGGRYAALSRSDRETNAIAFSDDMHCWNDAHVIQVPDQTWELLQLGNCGSPIETEHGWLVLTHGVGAMRTYSLGAMLLDLDEPNRVLARTEHPIISPDAGHRDGYVPNVIYSCGGFAHNDTLVLPYGIADQSISIATVSISNLIDSMRRDDPQPVA
jgi:predicted GH43/DUF377 family glycosyl hydrolase